MLGRQKNKIMVSSAQHFLGDISMTVSATAKIIPQTHTRDLSLLSPTQKENYLRDGFLILRDFISTDVCDLLMERGKKLIEDFNPEGIKTIFSTKDQRQARNRYFLDSGNKIHFFFEESAVDAQGELKFEKSLCINKFGHALHDLDPVFNCFSRQHKIAQLAKDLDLLDPLVMQSMYICKQPHIGGEVGCHQDASYLYSEKLSVTGLWFALEDATIENGCLWAIPGGHNTELKSRFIRNPDDTTRMEVYDESAWDETKAVPLEVPRGSVIVLHGLSPHMSKENMSTHSRHAYILHVMASDDEFAKNNWLQRPENDSFTGFLI